MQDELLESALDEEKEIELLIDDNSKRLETKRILLFVGITFVITYVLEIELIGNLVKSDDTDAFTIARTLTALMMFIPTIGVLITRLITKEGFKSAWIKPNLKGNIIYYLMAWFGPVILTLLGMLFYFIIFPDKFDSNMTYLVDFYKVAGITMTTEQLRATMMAQLVTGIFLAPLLNVFTCFGEEWGWRGYLLPKMTKKFSLIPMLFMNGIIWGLWHAPLTVMGHNYGIGYPGFPYMGIFAMSIFCIVIGTLFSYISLRTKSCLPAVFAHGSLNGFAAFGIYFAKDGGNPFIGPAPTGIIGGIPFIVAAIVVVIFMLKDNNKETNINL